MRNVNLERWRGKRDPVALDPAAMVYEAQPAGRGKDKCKGCIFNEQWGAVCKAAAARAIEHGLPDCDNGFIYVAGARRQPDLFDMSAAHAA
jgi:hypothetical protein